MLFLSTLLGTAVVGEGGVALGRVRDIAMQSATSAYPTTSGIVVAHLGKDYFVKAADIDTLSERVITLTRTSLGKPFDAHRPELLLARDMLDKQIFDIDSIRVVRVNDIQLALIKKDLCMVAIDVSLYAVLRRLGIPAFCYRAFLSRELIEWEDLDLVHEEGKKLKLKTSYEKLKKLHPADIANLIEHISLPESAKILSELDAETAAEVIQEVEPKYKDILLEAISHEDLAETIEELSDDEAADIIRDLSAKKRKQVLEELTATRARELTHLAHYDDNTAGALMTAEFPCLSEDLTTEDALNRIRKSSDDYASLYHLFTRDSRGKLTGVLSLRRLICAKKSSPLSDIAVPVAVTVTADTQTPELALLLTKYDLLSLAVVNDEEKMIGLVTVDDVLRTLLPHA